MYQYLFFDLDGTLTDSKEGITKSVQAALKRFGIEVKDPHELVPFIGPPLTSSFMGYYGFTEEQAQEAVAAFRSRYNTMGLFENRPYPGIENVLASLKKEGKKLLTASSKPEPLVHRILEHFGLAPYFDLMAGAGEDERKAEKACVIENAIERYGIPGEARKEIVMIGDRRHDVEGAHRCGIDCLGVRYGFANPGELEKAGADYIVSTVKEMETFLLTH